MVEDDNKIMGMIMIQLRFEVNQTRVLNITRTPALSNSVYVKP